MGIITDKTILSKIEVALDEIRPFLEADGGDINFIELNFDGWRNNKDWDGKSGGFGSNKTHTLHSEGLVKDDMHLSGAGNKKLAVEFYEALKDEKLFSS